MRVSDGVSENGTIKGLVEAKTTFEEYFGNVKSVNAIITPASIMLLGDHTHYNDGIILSASLNVHTVTLLRKRNDDKIIIINAANGDIQNCTLTDIPSESHQYFKYLLGLTQTFFNENLIRQGFECVFNSPVPESIGLGKISSLEIGFACAVKKTFNLPTNHKDMLSLVRKSELNVLGKISNFAHLFTTRFQKDNKLSFYDLRTNNYKSISLNKEEFDLVILDTGEQIIEPHKICNERIEECEVGVKGLRLYIWGIKNLRDVESDFLLRHYHMLPRKIFSRVLYNVKERMRVEEALKHLKKNSIAELGKCITESHGDMSRDYELSCEKCDFIVSKSLDYHFTLGSKMISCSPIRSTFHIIKKNYAHEFVQNISAEYKDKYNEDLISFTFHLSDGIKEITAKEVEFLLQ